jgi:hypothetical protein
MGRTVASLGWHISHEQQRSFQGAIYEWQYLAALVFGLAAVVAALSLFGACLVCCCSEGHQHLHGIVEIRPCREVAVGGSVDSFVIQEQ